MDRKGNQKIKLTILISITVILIILGFVGKLIYENKLLSSQKEELSVIYPEYKTGLSENLDFYHNITIHENIVVLTGIILIVAVLYAALIFIMNSGHKKQLNVLNSELNLLYEQLCSLRENNTLEISDEITNEKIRDISEKLKELDYDIVLMKNRLEYEENRTKSLITDISHQLKTPLSSIRMSHELSSGDDLTEEERQSFIEVETKEILKMEALLDELVKLSRLENSMIQINPETSSLKSTISEAVNMIYMKATAKNIEISLDMKNDIRTLHDHKWTAEALANIIENAVKYSDENSSVQIRVSMLIQNVLIEIEDDGIGIPLHEENEIFKRFYRGSNARTFSKDGAGVGLYLSRSIIEQQGGTIVVKRKTPHGSLFKITLPV